MPDLGFGQLIGLVVVIGFILAVLVDKVLDSQRRQQAHRERMAMIEKGIVPPPEADPARWEAFLAATKRPDVDDVADVAADVRERVGHRVRRDHQPADVARAFGILLVAIGLGLGNMLYFVGAGQRAAIGIGGMVLCIGAGFLTLSIVGRRPPAHRN